MSPDVPATAHRWLGARLDWVAVKRDAVLAGGFTALNTLSGTLDPVWLLPGLAFGAGIGAILHLVPAVPDPDDSRRGRIIVRGICGTIGGAWAGFGIGLLASGYASDLAGQPSLEYLGKRALVGAVTGAAWYVAWGFWETRGGSHRRVGPAPS